MSQSENTSKYLSKPADIEGMPTGIPYIIGNEAAERFSFYGMKAILVIFMTKYLHLMVDGEVGPEMSKAAANVSYHEFASWTYLFPVVGSLLADVFLGKYRTIFWLSIVYCVGHLSLALMGSPGMLPATWMTIGLFLVAFGSGGIKPCVSAHVGDQFGSKNSHLMSKIFQLFYFAINVGSTLSIMITPLLLEWYGPHIAFGVPGVLMAIATLMFWMGRHKFIHVPASGLAFFKDTFSREGIIALLKLSIIYAFIAVFWSLFDQTGSSWVQQAENMDRHFLGVEWLQSQIQVINPILVLIFIPLFQFVVYPAVDPYFKLTPIRKISIGLFLAAGSFALLMMAQELIDKGETPSISWQIWAYVLLTSAEIMISITGLEFSYTQSPKCMKSVVMAIWLASVSLGNFYASTMNNQIQTPGVNQITLEAAGLEIDEKSTIKTWEIRTTEVVREDPRLFDKMVQVSGVDGTFDTADDILLKLEAIPKSALAKLENKAEPERAKNIFFKLDSVGTSENEILEQAAEKIDEVFFASAKDAYKGKLPLTEKGTELLVEMKDSLGNPLLYKLLSRNKYRISTAGADSKNGTQWDIVLIATISRAIPKEESTKEEPYTWIENRIIEIRGEEGIAEVKKSRGDIPETEIEHEITVGGQDTIEGAAYYRFWTIAILIFAVLFIPVGYFYKEKSYIQSEEDADTQE